MAVKRNKKGQLEKGSILNPEGRPEGKNYETRRKEALIELAKLNPNKTPEQLDIMIITKGLGEALKGSFQFYKDDTDRLHGQATSKLDLNNPIMNDEIKKNTEMVKNLIDSFKNGNRKKTTLPETPPPV